MSWPTAAHILLLQAALLEDEVARTAFTTWLPTATGRLDPGSRRLLPLLFLNLRALGVSEAEQSRFAEAWQRVGDQNETLVAAVAPVLHAMRAHGVECAVLKGMALALHYYPAPAARPMDDCDLLVRPAHALRARDVLVREGWRPDSPLDRGVIGAVHAARFTGPVGHFLDLHWHVQPESSDARADAEHWQAMDLIDVGGAPVRMLGPADTIQHVVVHGLRWSTTPPVRWAADALMVMRRAGARVDWDRLLGRAARQGVVLPVRDALAFLHDTLDAPVPAGVLDRLSLMPVTRSERLEYRIKRQPRTRARLAILHWFQHRRLARGTIAGDVVRFPRYLQRLWAVRPRQVAARPPAGGR